MESAIQAASLGGSVCCQLMPKRIYGRRLSQVGRYDIAEVHEKVPRSRKEGTVVSDILDAVHLSAVA